MDAQRKRRLVRRPSPAMIVACIGLAVALSGTGYAAVVLPRNSVGTAQLKANAVKTAKVASNTLNGTDINEATLGPVPSAVNASTAASATNAANAANAENAGTLDALDSTAFLRANGKAADSDTVDGLDSTAFLRSGSVRVAATSYQAGALPVSTGFTTNGGRILVMVSGSGYETTVGQACIDIAVNSGNFATVCHYFNQTSEHLALPTRMFTASLAAGSHTIELRAVSGLSSDINDRYQITVLELPS